jgi:hypothetical protein
MIILKCFASTIRKFCYSKFVQYWQGKHNALASLLEEKPQHKERAQLTRLIS